MFLSLAFIFAGLKSYGQVTYQTVPSAAPICITPTPFTDGACTATELKPVQGEVYTYTVVTTGATDDVRWFVVNNADLSDGLIEDGAILPSTDANIDPANGSGDYILRLGDTHNTYNVNPNSGDATGTDNSIEIAWKYFDGHQPNEVLLVAYVVDDDACTDNIAVFRIIPQPAFTIDIVSVLANGSNPAGPGDTPNEDCVSPIESATYASIDDETPNGTLTVDYGENWIFFVVNGANYIDSWMPEFLIDYDGGTAPTAQASWAYLGDATNPDPANWNALTGSLNNGTWTSANPVIAGASAASSGTIGAGVVPDAEGECIVVRVRLDWGTDIEHDLNNSTLTFAANGIAYDGVGPDFFDNRSGFEDLHHLDCEPDGFDNDIVDFIITPRPRANEGTPEQEDKTGEGVN